MSISIVPASHRPAERGGVAVDPFASRMLRGLAPRGDSLRREKHAPPFDEYGMTRFGA